MICAHRFLACASDSMYSSLLPVFGSMMIKDQAKKTMYDARKEEMDPLGPQDTMQSCGTAGFDPSALIFSEYLLFCLLLACESDRKALLLACVSDGHLKRWMLQVFWHLNR